jgi:hypothetical protein
MKVGEPDVEALRALFADLEFTSLLKELLPVVEVKQGAYQEIKSKAEFEQYLKDLAEGVPLALAIPTEHTDSTYSEGAAEEDEPQPAQSGFLALQPADDEGTRRSQLPRPQSSSRFPMRRERGRGSRWKTGRLPSE